MRRLLLWSLAVAVLVVLLLCAEMVLRFGPWEIEPALRLDYETFVAVKVDHKGAFRYIYMRDNDLFWKGRPDTKWTGRVGHDIPAEMNSHGFRQREFSLAKPASTLRIACLGDSRTFGLGVWEKETYPRQLEGLLRARHPGHTEIEVLNLGVMGYSMFQGWISLNINAPLMQPDVVTFAFGFNDMMPAKHPDSVYYENGHSGLGKLRQFLCKSKLFVVYEMLVLRVTRELTKKPEPHVLKGQEDMYEEIGCAQIGGELKIENRRVSDDQYEELLVKAIDFCKSRSILPIVISIPQRSLHKPYLQAPKYHELMNRVCDKCGVKVIDLLPACMECINSGPEEEISERVEQLLLGVCHPAPHGHSLIAEEIAKQLESLGVLPQ